MDITIFGASGRTGSSLLEEALQRGYHVTAYVRNASRIAKRHPHLQIVEGSLEDTDLLLKVVSGRHAVISALGVSKVLRNDPAVVTGIRNIARAIGKQSVTRFIYQSAFLVEAKSGEFSFFASNILRQIISNELHDHKIKENLIRENVRNYTIVRPVRLTNEPFTGTIKHGPSITSKEFLPAISRADVAHFMIDQLTDKKYMNTSVRVMKSTSR